MAIRTNTSKRARTESSKRTRAIQIDRWTWFHQQARAGRAPNARSLMDKYEISERTAQRDIDYMRDSLRAPLEYVHAKRGYIYTDPDYQLPFLDTPTQEELLAFLAAKTVFEKSVSPLPNDDFRKLFMRLWSGKGLTEEKLNTLFSSAWREAPPSDPKIFAEVCRALMGSYCLRFAYFSPATAHTTQRLVEPHHLRYYMGAWILFAWDRDRRDWRSFYLTRIGEVLESLPWQTFTPRPRAEWETQFSANYGIFQGQKRYDVVLRFNEFRARWIRYQIWHENQTMRDLPDGGVELTVPVADLREIQMEVMRFGAGVEVISPPELRNALREELARTMQLYEK